MNHDSKEENAEREELRVQSDELLELIDSSYPDAAGVRQSAFEMFTRCDDGHRRLYRAAQR